MAKIRQGKNKGIEVEILRWDMERFFCKTSDGQEVNYSPAALSFTEEEYYTIITNDNFDYLAVFYEPVLSNGVFTFKKRRW